MSLPRSLVKERKVVGENMALLCRKEKGLQEREATIFWGVYVVEISHAVFREGEKGERECEAPIPFRIIFFYGKHLRRRRPRFF